MNTAFHNARLLAVGLTLSTAALVACQSQPTGVTAPAAEVATPVAGMPAPQAPFDTTSITPVESAGAAPE
jgi:hypothetical protein